MRKWAVSPQFKNRQGFRCFIAWWELCNARGSSRSRSAASAAAWFASASAYLGMALTYRSDLLPSLGTRISGICGESTNSTRLLPGGTPNRLNDKTEKAHPSNRTPVFERSKYRPWLRCEVQRANAFGLALSVLRVRLAQQVRHHALLVGSDA